MPHATALAKHQPRARRPGVARAARRNRGPTARLKGPPPRRRRGRRAASVHGGAAGDGPHLLLRRPLLQGGLRRNFALLHELPPILPDWFLGRVAEVVARVRGQDFVRRLRDVVVVVGPPGARGRDTGLLDPPRRRRAHGAAAEGEAGAMRGLLRLLLHPVAALLPSVVLEVP